MSTPKPDSKLLVAGRVGAPRGLRGEVTVELRTDSPQERFAPGSVVATDSKDFPSLTVERLNLQGRRASAAFTEVTTREQAESLRGTELLVGAQEDTEAWYAHELVGLDVVTTDGEERGVVADLLFGAAHEQLVVEYQGRTVRVPFVEEIVPEIDIPGGRVVVAPPEGLFEDEQIG